MRAVNLIPAEQRRAKPSGKASGSAYAIVGVLAVFLVMAVAYVLTSNQVNENETKAAEAKQQADALEAQAAALGSFTNFAAIKDQRLASVVTQQLQHETSVRRRRLREQLDCLRHRCSDVARALSAGPDAQVGAGLRVARRSEEERDGESRREPHRAA